MARQRPGSMLPRRQHLDFTLSAPMGAVLNGSTLVRPAPNSWRDSSVVCLRQDQERSTRLCGQPGTFASSLTWKRTALAQQRSGLGGLAFDRSKPNSLRVGSRDGHRACLQQRRHRHRSVLIMARPLAHLARSPASRDDGKRADIKSPFFDASKPATWGFTQKERRIDALAVHDGRLFYAVAEDPKIWSVGLDAGGKFSSDPRLETNVSAEKPYPVTGIVFDQTRSDDCHPTRDARKSHRLLAFYGARSRSRRFVTHPKIPMTQTHRTAGRAIRRNTLSATQKASDPVAAVWRCSMPTRPTAAIDVGSLWRHDYRLRRHTRCKRQAAPGLQLGRDRSCGRRTPRQSKVRSLISTRGRTIPPRAVMPAASPSSRNAGAMEAVSHPLPAAEQAAIFRLSRVVEIQAAVPPVAGGDTAGGGGDAFPPVADTQEGGGGTTTDDAGQRGGAARPPTGR